MCLKLTRYHLVAFLQKKKKKETGEKQVAVFVRGHFQVYKCDISVPQKEGTSIASLLHSNAQWKNLDNSSLK